MRNSSTQRYKKLLVIIVLSLAMIVTLVPYDRTISFALSKNQDQINTEESIGVNIYEGTRNSDVEGEQVNVDAKNPSNTKEKEISSEPTRSNSAPTLVSGVTSVYEAYGVVGTDFGFANGWLEDFFTDTDPNTTLTFYSSLDQGTTKTQDGITVLWDEDNNRYVTSYVYNPTSTGEKEIRLYAYDGVDYSSDYIKITLTVYAANSDATLYVDVKTSSSVSDLLIKKSNNAVLDCDASSEANNIKTYSYRMRRGETYSFSGVPDGGNASYRSGMTFDIPFDFSVTGTPQNPYTVFIKQVNVTVKAGGVAQQADYYDLVLKDADLQEVTIGKDTASNSTNTPILVYANGYAELYTFEVDPTHSSLSGYAKLYQGNQSFTANTTTQTVNLTLPSAISYAIKIPNDATLQVYRQIRNYQTEKIDNGTATTVGNYKQYTFRLPQNGSGYTYKVSKSGCITKAGYLSLTASNTNDPLTIDFNSGLPSLTLAEAILSGQGYDTSTTLGSRAEDSVLLNVKKDSNTHFSHNFRSLNSEDGEEETFKLRAYRGAWQIINSDTANIMIEPDFHFTKVRGSNKISINQDPGNDGHQNWCDVTANTNASGLAIVKVTYDAIDVDGMSYSNNASQRFYSTAEGREGYAIFNVGGTEIDGLMINAATSGTRESGVDWDSEIDTFYYLGSSGTFKINPTAPNDTITQVAYTHSPTGSFTTVTKSGNYYDIPISGDFNLIRIKAGTKVEYVPVRSAQITILVDDQPLTDNTTVTKNESHTIKLRGVYMPVPKFSGIYNPMMNKVNYSVGGSTVSGNNLQYNFITQNTITWTPTSTGTYNFTNGYHSMRMFCNTTAKWGHHRLLTDVGVGANFNAGQVNGVFNIYPDFTINVQ